MVATHGLRTPALRHCLPLYQQPMGTQSAFQTKLPFMNLGSPSSHWPEAQLCLFTFIFF